MLEYRTGSSSWVIGGESGLVGWEFGLLGQKIPVLHHTSSNQVINRDATVCFRAPIIECPLQLGQIESLKVGQLYPI